MADMKQILPQGNVYVPGVPDFYDGRDLRYTKPDKEGKEDTALLEALYRDLLTQSTPSFGEESSPEAKAFFKGDPSGKIAASIEEEWGKRVAEGGGKTRDAEKWLIDNAINYSNFQEAGADLVQMWAEDLGISQNAAAEVHLRVSAEYRNELKKTASKYVATEQRRNAKNAIGISKSIGRHYLGAAALEANKDYFTDEEYTLEMHSLAVARDEQLYTEVFEQSVIAPYYSVVREKALADAELIAKGSTNIIPLDQTIEMRNYLTDILVNKDEKNGKFQAFVKVVEDSISQGWVSDFEAADPDMDPNFLRLFASSGMKAGDASKLAEEIIEREISLLDVQDKADKAKTLDALEPTTAAVHELYGFIIAAPDQANMFYNTLMNYRKDVQDKIRTGVYDEPSTRYVMSLIDSGLDKSRSSIDKELSALSLKAADEMLWRTVTQTGGTKSSFITWLFSDTALVLKDGTTRQLTPDIQAKYFEQISFLEKNKDVTDAAVAAIKSGVAPGVVSKSMDDFLGKFYSGMSTDDALNASQSFVSEMTTYMTGLDKAKKTYKGMDYKTWLSQNYTPEPYDELTRHAISSYSELEKAFSAGIGPNGEPLKDIFKIASGVVQGAYIQAGYGGDEAAKRVGVVTANSNTRFDFVGRNGTINVAIPMAPPVMTTYMTDSGSQTQAIVFLDTFELYPPNPNAKGKDRNMPTIEYGGEAILYPTVSANGRMEYILGRISRDATGKIRLIEGAGKIQPWMNQDFYDYARRKYDVDNPAYASPGGKQAEHVVTMVGMIGKDVSYQQFSMDQGLAYVPQGLAEMTPIERAEAWRLARFADPESAAFAKANPKEDPFFQDERSVSKKSIDKTLKGLGVDSPTAEDYFSYVAAMLPGYMAFNTFGPISANRQMQLKRLMTGELGIPEKQVDEFMTLIYKRYPEIQSYFLRTGTR